MLRVVYKSKIDWWIAALLAATCIGVVFAAYQVNVKTNYAHSSILIGILLILVGGIWPLWLLAKTSYILEGSILLVCFGPFRTKIPIAKITEIVPSRSLLSAPALSLDRLHIKYEGSRFGALVSPADKAAFLQDVASRSNRLKVMNDRAVMA